MLDGSSWPRVSIVTASLNQGRFIEETIRSVLLQGYPNLEYIVLDGGSSDNTVEIVKRYAAWLVHWVSEPDLGQSDAINKGFQRAKGEILAWLNADDIYCPRAVRIEVDFLNTHPDVSVVYGGASLIDRDGRIVLSDAAGGF
jgi:glycosyltransferase involved in cell wall biosynthesis